MPRHHEVQVCTTEQGQQTTPDKCKVVPKKRKREKFHNVVERSKDFDLLEVPLGHLSGAPPTSTRRHRIRTLEFWRGERLVYERPPGSACAAPRAALIAHDVRPPMPGEVISTPPEQEHEESQLDCRPEEAVADVVTPPPRRHRIAKEKKGNQDEASPPSIPDEGFVDAELAEGSLHPRCPGASLSRQALNVREGSQHLNQATA